jgi:glycine dehydrogenase
MLRSLGYESLDELTDAAVPTKIKLERHLELEEPQSEVEVLQRIKEIAAKNQVRNVPYIMTFSVN